MTAPITASLAVGNAPEPRVFGPISRSDIVRYAGASGDFNPIHHDDEFARTAGFPSVFSIGMFQASLLGGFAADWLGPENLRRFTVRFSDQVWPGDELTCSASIIRLSTTAEGTIAEVDLSCTRQTGAVAISGSAEFLLPG